MTSDDDWDPEANDFEALTHLGSITQLTETPRARKVPAKRPIGFVLKPAASSAEKNRQGRARAGDVVEMPEGVEWAGTGWFIPRGS